jgi:hypothetical protein
VRQAARRHKAINRNPVLAEQFDDPPQAERRRFQQRSIQMARPMMERQPGKSAAKRAIHQRRAAAIEPVETEDAIGAGRDRCRFVTEAIEVFMSDRAAKPIKCIPHGRLARFIAEQPGQDAPFDNACHARHTPLVAGVKHVATARSQNHDQRARLGDAGPGNTGMGINCGGADRNPRAEVQLASHALREQASRLARAKKPARHLLANGVGQPRMHRGEEVAGRVSVVATPSCQTSQSPASSQTSAAS